MLPAEQYCCFKKTTFQIAKDFDAWEEKNSKPQNLHAVHPNISITCLKHDCQDFVTMSCFPPRGDMKEMAWLLQQDEELQAILDHFFMILISLLIAGVLVKDLTCML